ncbi:MAG: hypothetical protein K6A98_00660 [Prevotella sp.]|nr:hypothetical protein [Prevotella sp.]
MNDQKQYKWAVCTSCMTYNQSVYIEDALNGFTMQETNFPYVCIICDDASTDGEQDVIRNYLEQHFELDDKTVTRNEETEDYFLMFARHKTNHNCFFAVLFLKYNHYGKKSKFPYISKWMDNSKYLAMCEGDDYWTAPQKLQMQVDYLETHPNIVLSCHQYSVTDVLTGKTSLRKNLYFDRNKNKDSFEFDIRYAFNGQWITKTLTLVMRCSCYNSEEIGKFKYHRDVHNIYFAMKKGNGVCHAINAGVYRKNVSTSIFGNLDNAGKTKVNYNVFTEMADITHDPIICEVAKRVSVKHCIDILQSCGGCYVLAVKIPYYFHKGINFIRHGFRRRGIPPISV